jgi:GrpB-like predicted nucleotidyltransferase (UPF0157 family)
MPIDHLGSRFRIGPLTGPDSRVRVQVMHLAPGDWIGRHPTAVQQLFAVVAGAAEVSGADAVPRRVGPGYAVVWEVGEDHDARSEPGCTAICVEGSFDMWALQVTRDIIVADHDPAWAQSFERIHGPLWPALEGVALRIDHVGSTSVPGLAAKPIIDTDVVVADEAGVRPAIVALRTLGYVGRGDLGVEGRQAFINPPGDLPEHNLYVVVDGNKAHLDHVLLRDLLRADPVARDRYAALKRANAELAGGDMDVYVEAKAALVAELLTRARAERGLPEAEYWTPEPRDAS